MRHFRIGGRGENATHDCNLQEQTEANQFRSLKTQVRQMLAIVSSLKHSEQVDGRAFEAYQRVEIIAAGLGLGDMGDVLFERGE
jgi:hypothetical protein